MSNKFDSIINNFLTEAGVGMATDPAQKKIKEIVDAIPTANQEQIKALGSALLGDNQVKDLNKLFDKTHPMGISDFIKNNPEHAEQFKKLISDYNKSTEATATPKKPETSSQTPPPSQAEGGTTTTQGSNTYISQQ